MIWLHCLTNTFSSTFNLSIMKKIFKSLFFSLLALVPMGMQAQKLHYNAGLETTHLWRGLEVSKGLTFNNEFSLSDNNNHFKIGLWGGMQINGNYKEFDYYVNYNNSGFNLAVWDIYNFSDGLAPEGSDWYKIGNYNCRTTGHFIDAAVSYDFAVKAGFPLTLYWSTIVAGRDRGTANKQNIYSSWVQASYKFYEDEQFRVDGSVAGAFALNNYDENSNDHFYGKSSGINDVVSVVPISSRWASILCRSQHRAFGIQRPTRDISV